MPPPSAGCTSRRSGQSDEADLVDALRAAGALRISLVAAEGATVIGHVAFSAVVVRAGASTINTLGLAPMAVLPEYQGRGIGSRLVRAGLAACGDTPYGLVFVLGAPPFYGRFGFTPAKPLGLTWEHGGAAGRLHGSGAATGHAARRSRRGGVPAGIRWFVVTATPQPPLSGGLSGFRPIPPDKGGKGGYVIKRSEACESA